MQQNKTQNELAILLGIVFALFVFMSFIEPLQKTTQKLLSPLSKSKLKPLQTNKNDKEIFGFAPYWTFNNLNNVDFDVLTTLAYFDVPVDSYGDLIKDGPGYQTFMSQQATDLFTKAHAHGTRVVLTLTAMNNGEIEALMDNYEGQQYLINQAVQLVKDRGIDGINVDFEYMGDPGQAYRDKFTTFIKNLTERMHAEVASSRVTVAVYASAVKDPKIYDLTGISQYADGVFMMAYDFAVASSDSSMPTSPLYGYKEGQYWYDISTAVDDFLRYMPANKLILGTAWYDWNRPVYQPGVKASTLPYWSAQPVVQTYSIVQQYINSGMDGVTNFITGWDDYGKVSWRAYYNSNYGIWRQVFIEDRKSLGIKYDFAKQKDLGGVGIWALGFDEGRTELWSLLSEKFGKKQPDHTIVYRTINAGMSL